jgi:hypothetical protein
VLAAALESAPNHSGIETSVYLGKAPRDPIEIADADAFVIESSSDRIEGETRPLFPPDPLTPRRGYDDETTAYLEAFDALVKSGKGMVILHYATWAENWDARGCYSDNMLVDDYRRFLSYGIVWAAGRDVPAGGVQSETPVGIEPFAAPARRPEPTTLRVGRLRLRLRPGNRVPSRWPDLIDFPPIGPCVAQVRERIIAPQV